MVDNVCFIPARDSSTRLKNKNIAEFKAGNLITHTIEQAIESKVFQRIVLSSNNEDILNMGSEYDIELHKRLDTVDTLIEVIQEAIPTLRIPDEFIFGLLLVTCPLRKADDIAKAYELFKEAGGQNTVVSVKKNENPIQMAWRKVDEHLVPVMPDEYGKSTRKQDHFDTFFYNDAIILDTVKNFMDPSRNLFGNDPIAYVMPWERSIAIDYEFQLRIAQCLGKMEDKNG